MSQEHSFKGSELLKLLYYFTPNKGGSWHVLGFYQLRQNRISCTKKDLIISAGLLSQYSGPSSYYRPLYLKGILLPKLGIVRNINNKIFLFSKGDFTPFQMRVWSMGASSPSFFHFISLHSHQLFAQDYLKKICFKICTMSQLIFYLLKIDNFVLGIELEIILNI